jgi:hypothetical protein
MKSRNIKIDKLYKYPKDDGYEREYVDSMVFPDWFVNNILKNIQKVPLYVLFIIVFMY